METPQPKSSFEKFLDKINEPIGGTPNANLSFGKVLGIFFLGMVLLLAILGTLFDAGVPSDSKPKPDIGQEEIARKIANGEELSPLEKKVIKQWEEEGRKRSR